MPFPMMARRLAASRLGIDGTWTSKDGGAPVAIRLVPIQPADAIAGLGGPRQAARLSQAFIPADAIPGAPQIGDLIEMGGHGFVVAALETDSRRAAISVTLRRQD